MIDIKKQIENYCKKHKLIKLKSDSLGGEMYYLDTKKYVVLKFSIFSKKPTFEIATNDEIDNIIKLYNSS